MMFTVLIVFVILRVPFTTLVFIRNHMLKDNKVNQVQGAFDILWYCSHYLMFCNAAINPIIYGLTNDNFRKAYRQTPLIKLFCNSKRIATPKQGGPCQDRRIQNMLLDQADNVQAKADNGQTLNVEVSSPGTETSNIWYTKKTAAEGPKNPFHGISTNLNDSETDPLDYDLIENSESQAEKVGEEAKDPQETEKGISEENFI